MELRLGCIPVYSLFWYYHSVTQNKTHWNYLTLKEKQTHANVVWWEMNAEGRGTAQNVLFWWLFFLCARMEWKWTLDRKKRLNQYSMFFYEDFFSPAVNWVISSENANVNIISCRTLLWDLQRNVSVQLLGNFHYSQVYCKVWIIQQLDNESVPSLSSLIHSINLPRRHLIAHVWGFDSSFCDQWYWFSSLVINKLYLTTTSLSVNILQI